MEKQTNHTTKTRGEDLSTETKINTVIGTGILRCDHCRTEKQCEKIVYNKFGNVIFICEDCKRRAM